MSDYGHELLFGTFLTPSAANADQVVELALLSEMLGFDLVTVQDHPYQARHLDTWTLLTAIAAQTSAIRVAPNVANLPLRPPVVLARSVATLDILSRGRVELGLGAGAFYEAIAAVGGPRLRAGEAVTALSEGIDVIRSMWNVEGGALRHEGKHYRIKGAHPGPAPVHDIELWLGAYKPRMLALTGAKADGWLPSSSYAGVEELAGMNAAIDEAALAAGRTPADIRRLYNISGEFGSGTGFLTGPPTEWAEQLAELTLTRGMSAFILGSDSADMLRRFAGEVVPLVREMVDAGRNVTRPDEVAQPISHPAGRWEESSRPTGPALEPGQRHTPQPQAAGQHLVDVHDALRSELQQLRDLIEQVAAGSVDAGSARSLINTMTMRQNNWTLGAYCESYCRILTGHHSLEDRSVFPHLRRRDPRLEPVIDRLEEEHEYIAGVLEQLDRALVALVTHGDGLVQLREAVDLLTDTLLSHLAYEERELIPPLDRFGFF